MFSAIVLTISVIIACICYFSSNVAIIVGGCALGCVAANQLIILHAGIMKDDMKQFYQGMLFTICGAIGIVVGWKLQRVCIVLATSLTGATMFAFGVGSILNNFPDIKLLEEDFKKYNVNSYKYLDTWTWIYFIGTLVLFISGAIVQFHKTDKVAETEDDTYAKDNNMMNSDDYSGYY